MRTTVKSFILKFVILGLVFALAYCFRPTYAFLWRENMDVEMTNHYSVMTVNVGNSDLQCYKYSWKLCKKEVEQRLSENIQTIAPDIIAFQEILPPWKCDGRKETNPNIVCYDSQDIPQVRRLLGDRYSIVIDSNNQYEGIGVRVDKGEILGCPLGEFCISDRTIPVIPGCDPGFSISAATIQLNNGARFDLVNVHPPSFSDECRSKMIKLAFQGDKENPPIIQQENVLVMGDFNLDPWRSRDDSSAVWNDIFQSGWRGKSFVYHSGIAEKNPPHYTLRLLGVRRTLDLVLSNFAKGVCKVMGETPGTYRLDGGKGNDHRAVFGVLEILP